MTEEVAAAERPKRLSLSHIVELLLTRSSGERSHVTITRKDTGAMQIDVSVRTGDSGDVLTVEDAEAKCVEVFERLHALFPAANAHDATEVALTRNAKGETQMTVSGKTTPAGYDSLEALCAAVVAAYDKTRMRYPLADGMTAKPGSVK